MIIIAEKINATRKSVARALADRDAEAIRRLLMQQAEAGCDYIDLNAGRGVASVDQSIDDMKWLIDLALEATDRPLSLDSPDARVIAAGAAHLGGARPWLLNSINASEESLADMLPVAAGRQAPFIALCMDGHTIADQPEQRVQCAERILERAAALGAKPSAIFFDPLVLPVGNDNQAPNRTLETLRVLKQRVPQAHTIVGLSNVSYGLPVRALINQTFLVGCIFAGVDAAILDPTDRTLRRGLLAAEALAGRDEYCKAYLKAFRAGLLEEKEEGEKT
jgi:5-methyltetrahydrofolate--homocysteine methyltransferase